MEKLANSFKQHLGIRGVHYYSEQECFFLAWPEVVRMVDTATEQSENGEFYEKLLEVMCNCDPDTEFVALHKEGAEVSIEWFSRARG